jgi:hypothetical protein
MPSGQPCPVPTPAVQQNPNIVCGVPCSASCGPPNAGKVYDWSGYRVSITIGNIGSVGGVLKKIEAEYRCTVATCKGFLPGPPMHWGATVCGIRKWTGSWTWGTEADTVIVKENSTPAEQLVGAVVPKLISWIVTFKDKVKTYYEGVSDPEEIWGWFESEEDKQAFSDRLSSIVPPDDPFGSGTSWVGNDPCAN